MNKLNCEILWEWRLLKLQTMSMSVTVPYDIWRALSPIDQFGVRISQIYSEAGS